MAAVALVVGVLVSSLGGGPAGDRPPAARGRAEAERSPATSPAARLPLARRVGALLVMSFDGTAAPDYILRRLRTGEGTGVILFGKNSPDLASVRALTTSVQRAAGGRALVATDQEGGDVRSLAFAAPAASQGVQSSPDAAAATAREAAQGLRAAGVNVNLAPVADVAASNGSVVAGRAFPGDSTAVARATAAAVRAYGRERIAATAKHFPGLGGATANTDDASVTVSTPRADLLATAIPPFRAAIRAGAPLVMSSHALYPAFDRGRIASQSSELLDGLLRKRLGYRGVVVTDSLEAQAVLDRSDVATAAQRSIEGGSDLILMTGSGSFNQVQPKLLARARRDAAFRAKVTRAADRVLALKRRLGLG